MKYTIYLTTLFLLSFSILFSQSLDDKLSIEKMYKDFEIFKNIRIKANSGLYKYRSKQEIDSTYNWAFNEIKQSKTYRDFYNIICALTNFEGSLHNDTSLPKKLHKSMGNEKIGYFPYPIKLIEGKVVLNIENKEIPLGSEIISINDKIITKIIPNLYKYYTTDGANVTGKSIGINYNFSKYYRLHYGLNNSFKVTYKIHNSTKIEEITLQSTSYKAYYKNVENRYSKPFDKLDYLNYNEFDEKYSYKIIDKKTAIITINTFVIGWNDEDNDHKVYIKYLDSVFADVKNKAIKNLIIDVRHNGGGTDPNDLVSYSYLTQRNFSENKKAWISFNKFPYLKYAYTKVPRFLRVFGVGKYNKYFKEEFSNMKNEKFYQTSSSSDKEIRKPNKNAFNGNIYLLISPRVASAGSLFAAMVAGNENTITVGEETMGGYYGHNGHTPIGYILPKSKIEMFFSIVNLEQDVPEKKNQIHNRGIIPNYNVIQTYDDYLNQIDTQMNFVLNLIKKEQ